MKVVTALVSGFARSFISGSPICGAVITSLENNALQLYTDKEGKFGPFSWPVGTPMTLVLEKTGSFWSGYKTTQTATLMVPPEGFNHPDLFKNVSFQVPSNMAYRFLSFAMGKKEQKEHCQIAATITPPSVTMRDIPQGVEGVTVSLSACPSHEPFYFGVFPLVHKTNPFVRKLTATSLDGGVAFLNVPPGDYELKAYKEGVVFTTISIRARKGIVVNASPPYGAVAIEGYAPQPPKVKSKFSFFSSQSMALPKDKEFKVLSIN